MDTFWYQLTTINWPLNERRRLLLDLFYDADVQMCQNEGQDHIRKLNRPLVAPPPQVNLVSLTFTALLYHFNCWTMFDK